MPIPRASRPCVIANFAVTWDGRISTRNHTPSDFSSKRDKHRLLEIRALGDAVMAGAGTVLADRMTMGMPDERLRAERVARGQAEYPLRVLLTNSGRLDPESPVFQKDFSPIVIFSTHQMPEETRVALKESASLHLHEGEKVDLASVLQTLRESYAIRTLVCEGGGQLLRALLEAGGVDELYLTLCPRIFGSATAPTITGAPGDFLPSSVHAELQDMKVEKDEAFLHYRLHPKEH